MYPIRAVLIDSAHTMVRYVTISRREDVAIFIGGPYERAGELKGQSILVHEEGRIKDLPYSFELEGIGHHIGLGLVVGPEDQKGEWTDSALTAEDVRTRTRFFAKAFDEGSHSPAN